jgi:putative GTP pyrophosphokinase
MSDTLSDKATTLAKLGITAEQFERTGLNWEALVEIAQSHIEAASELQLTGDAVSGMLSNVREVHSLRVRVKSPDNLVMKIIRKKRDPNTATRIINLSNYTREITDLVGVRVLHLTKEDWERIDVVITARWDCIEKLAYYRKGDPPDWIRRYQGRGCDARDHPKDYRSVHYTVEHFMGKNSHLVEIQVRTLYEEGWAELDHKLRYPIGNPSEAVQRELTLLNRFAGGADEIAAEVMHRIEDEDRSEIERAGMRSHIDNLETRIVDLQDQVRELNIRKTDKKDLLDNIEGLKKALEASQRVATTDKAPPSFAILPVLVDSEIPRRLHAAVVPRGSSGGPWVVSEAVSYQEDKQ